MITRRPSSTLQSTLRKELLSGSFPVGELFPSVRNLSSIYNVAPKTAQRSLQALEKEGLLVAEPRKGYRVLASTNNPRKGCPVAFLLESSDFENSAPLHFTLRKEVEKILAKRSFSVLSVFSENKTIDEVLTQVKMGRSWGILVDAINVDLLNRIKESGIPAVMIDSWVEDAPFDVVLQDNYQGGYQAAQHLIKKGNNKIAWVGPIGASAISRERFGGAASALAANGKFLAPDMCFECYHTQAEDTIRKLLTSTIRPDAILSLWSEVSVSVAKVAKELKLKIGKDFDMVGWSTADKYHQYSQAFENNKPPATITWNPAIMAETALSRLSERWANPKLPPMRLLVDTILKESNGKEL